MRERTRAPGIDTAPVHGHRGLTMFPSRRRGGGQVPKLVHCNDRIRRARRAVTGLCLLLFATLGMFGVLLATTVQAEERGSLRRFGAKVDIADDLTGTLFAGGAKVSVTGTVEGDVWVVGADVTVDQGAVGGLFVTGSDVRIGSSVGSRATVIGSKITIRSKLAGDLRAYGSSIEIGPETRVNGEASLHGATVRFAGESADRVVIEGDEVEFSGKTLTLKIEGTKVRIGPGAVIEGNAEIYTIGAPDIDPTALIKGQIRTYGLYESEGMRRYLRGNPLGPLLVSLMIGGSALIAGLIFLWLGAGGVEHVIDELIDSPGGSGLWGIATLIGVPLAAALLAFTIFGLPVGLLALMAMPLFLLLGLASSGFGIGEWLFNRLGDPSSPGHRAFHLMAGLLVLVLLSLIPYVGFVVLLVAMICGFGALLRVLRDRLRPHAIT